MRDLQPSRRLVSLNLARRDEICNVQIYTLSGDHIAFHKRYASVQDISGLPATGRINVRPRYLSASIVLSFDFVAFTRER